MAKLFLCIGGPLDGQRFEWNTATEMNYDQFNSAGTGEESAIMVWKGLFNGGKATKLPKMPRHRKAETPRDQDLQVWEEQRTI